MARRRGGLFVGAAECEEILGIGRDTRRRWIARGIIPTYRDPDTGTVHYPRPQLERLAAELRTDPPSGGDGSPHPVAAASLEASKEDR